MRFIRSLSRTRSDSAESVGTEQLVIRDSSEDHNYAGSGSSVGESPFVDLKTLKGESGERCVTPDSEKSAPDAAYEFETGWITSDEEGEGARAIEEIMADEQEQEEEEEDEEDKDLFDSGFGCMRRRRGRKGRPQKRRRSHCETGIGPKRVKPDPRIAKRKTRKAPILERSTKRESSSAQNSRLRVRISARSKKRPVSPKNKRKPVSKRERKLSDADSGKDSPKVVRARRRRVATSAPIKMHKIEKKRSSPPTTTSHHRTTRQSASFTRSRAIYSSRSTGTMLGRKDKKKRQKRARLASNSRDDEEEIKLAAGSLMRLAGLITSPIAPSRAATSWLVSAREWTFPSRSSRKRVWEVDIRSSVAPVIARRSTPSRQTPLLYLRGGSLARCAIVRTVVQSRRQRSITAVLTEVNSPDVHSVYPIEKPTRYWHFRQAPYFRRPIFRTDKVIARFFKIRLEDHESFCWSDDLFRFLVEVEKTAYFGLWSICLSSLSCQAMLLIREICHRIKTILLFENAFSKISNDASVERRRRGTVLLPSRFSRRDVRLSVLPFSPNGSESLSKEIFLPPEQFSAQII